MYNTYTNMWGKPLHWGSTCAFLRDTRVFLVIIWIVLVVAFLWDDAWWWMSFSMPFFFSIFYPLIGFIFYFIFIRLSSSHDSGYKFRRFTRVFLDWFFVLLLILFFISSFYIGLVGNWVLYYFFFNLLFIELSQSHKSDCGIDN
jgi:hypothetical protein